MTAPFRYDQVERGCWAACLAGLTRMPHERFSALVPVVQTKEEFNDRWPAYHDAAMALVSEAGYVHAAIHYHDAAPKGFAIGNGDSPRGVLHSVIVKDGVLWHDPHPSRAGIVGAFKWFEVLLPAVPTTGAAE